jgi:hypothetical protein
MSDTANKALGYTLLGLIVLAITLGFFFLFMSPRHHSKRHDPHHQVAPRSPPKPYVVPPLPGPVPVALLSREVAHG